MGYELDRLMQQFGVSTPTLTYSGMAMPVKPTDLAAGASAIDKSNYDALLAKYNADMPLYTSDQAKFKTYSNDYNNRLATTSLYDAPQFQRGAMSSPGTGMFTDQYSQMYQDVLGRAPDPSGMAYWKGKFGDTISPEEYADFRQSATGELNDRLPVYTSNGQGSNTSSRTVLEQPTYNTPTAAPVLQTAATTAPVVLPVGDGSPAGGEKGAGNDGSGGFPGSTMVGGISGPTTGLASFANSLAATLGNMSGGKGILGGISDAIARNVDPNFSHEGRAGRGSSADQANAALAAAESAAADTSGTGGFTSGANADGYGGGDLGAFLAKGGYISRYAQGGAISTKKVRRFDEGGGVGEGFGYGEGAGAAQGAGWGGLGSMGEGGGYYTNSDEATRRAIQETEGLMRDVDTSATSARGRGQSLGANLATRSLDNASNMGSFAAPGFGDLGQFLGSNPAASTSAPSGYFGRTTIAPEAEAPVNAPAGYFGRVTIAPEAEAPVGRYGRTTIAPDSSPEEAAAHMQAMQAIADGVTAQGNRNAGSFYEGADGRAKGGYIGHYAHGGAVRHYQAGGDVMSSMAEAELLIKALEGGKLTENEREDAMSKIAEIYRRIDEEPAQAAPAPFGGDLIQPMPESVPVMAQEPKQLTISQIQQARTDTSPLTALKETVENKPVVVEGAPLVRPLDPRLYGESNEVATGKGYSPMDPRLYGESNEVATGKGYSPFDPRLYGETNEVASGPGYSMPVVAQPAANSKLLDLAAKYTKPGFAPTFAQGSIDPGADRMALISQNSIANKIANPVVNIQPEYADDSASRLSMSMPMSKDAAIPMSPNMAMLQKMLMASQSQASPYADELRTARAAATAQTKAFNDMLLKAIGGKEDSGPSKAEMYFRLAAAFGAPTKTGNFSESLAEVNKSMAEQAKETRLANKAGQALKLQLGLEGAKVGMTAARDDVTALRALTGEEMKEKASAQRELIKEYFKSGEAQSTFGKQAQDEGLTPGTPAYQARVKALSDEALRRMTAGVEASLAQANASLASIGRADDAARLAREKFDAAQAKTKADAAKLSPPEIKMKEETSQALVTMKDAYADLVKALKLSANAYDGSLVDQAQYKLLSEAGNQDPKVINTGVLDNLLKLGALSTAATTLKTQISDSDMKMLNQVQGAGAKSRQERDAILKAAMVRLENMYQEKKSKLADIVGGKYRIATPAIAEEAE